MQIDQEDKINLRPRKSELITSKSQKIDSDQSIQQRDQDIIP